MKPPEKVEHASLSETSAVVAVVCECVPKWKKSDWCVFVGLADIKDHMFKLLAAYLHSIYSHCLWEVEVSPQNNLFKKGHLKVYLCVLLCVTVCYCVFHSVFALFRGIFQN